MRAWSQLSPVVRPASVLVSFGALAAEKTASGVMALRLMMLAGVCLVDGLVAQPVAQS